jgi:hypothetical protein
MTTLNGPLLANSMATFQGAVTVNNNTMMNGMLTVMADGTLGPNSDHVAYFVNTRGGSSDGVAIQIDDAPTSSVNNFITFYNANDHVAGRVEGFSLANGDPFSNFPIPSFGFSDFFIFNPNFIMFSGGSLPSLSIDFTGLDFSFSTGSLPTLSFSSPFSFTNPLAGVQAFADMICWAFENDFQSLIQTDPFGLALAPLILAEATLCKDGGFGGVTFGSTGADYAEWLPKLHLEERFLPGQIVGVHGGLISKVTEGAEQIMSISQAPVIIGNIPPADQEANYEKVGFMGQVPALVWGLVRKGDYIVPSGKNDGFGVAVAPGDLTAEQMRMVLGRAWSENRHDGPGLVNVVVGVKTNEWAEMLESQAAQIAELEQRLGELEQRSDSDLLREIEARLTRLEGGPSTEPVGALETASEEASHDE